MDVDNLEEEVWKDSSETFTGKGPQGEDTLFMLQKKGGAFRVTPKGGGRSAGKKGAASGGAPGGGGGKGETNKWDPNGCARCGRSTHWSKECVATTDVNGNPPKEKPKGPKKKKGKARGKGTLAEL